MALRGSQETKTY